MPSDAYVFSVTRLPSGACSASTSLIFCGPDQIPKLAAPFLGVGGEFRDLVTPSGGAPVF